MFLKGGYIMKRTHLKSLISFFMIIMLVIISSLNAGASESELPVTVFVDGEQIVFDVEPVIEDGRTLVPMRYIFEALGAEVDWITETSTAVAIKGDIRIEITVGKNEIIKNGSSIVLDVPAKITDGRTLVPVRAVSEGMEADVEWDGELRRVIITSKNDLKSEYNITELSPDDFQTLKNMEGDYRYVFEQELLPGEILAYATELAPLIELEAKEFADAIYEVWDQNLSNIVLNLQLESEDTYAFEKALDEGEEQIKTGYINILKKAGMDSASNFEVSYDTTPAGNEMLLLNFYNTGFDDAMLIVSKYIAVVESNGKCRYFTGELSPINSELLGREVWMLCEITESGRQNYGTLEETTKEAFVNKIDFVIDK